jgi:hypothetical protein
MKRGDKEGEEIRHERERDTGNNFGRCFHGLYNNTQDE